MEPPVVRERPSSRLLIRSWIVLAAVIALIDVFVFWSTGTSLIPKSVGDYLAWTLWFLATGAIALLILGTIGYLVQACRFIFGRWRDYDAWVVYGHEQRVIVEGIHSALKQQAQIFGSPARPDFMPCFRMHRTSFRDGKLTIILHPMTHVARKHKVEIGDAFILVDNAYPQILGFVTVTGYIEVQLNELVVLVETVQALLLTELMNKASSAEIIKADITVLPVDLGSLSQGEFHA